eukprot:scaffold168042_cov25-Tisochrysis_lutea.AAC.1
MIQLCNCSAAAGGGDAVHSEVGWMLRICDPAVVTRDQAGAIVDVDALCGSAILRAIVACECGCLVWLCYTTSSLAQSSAPYHALPCSVAGAFSTDGSTPRARPTPPSFSTPGPQASPSATQSQQQQSSQEGQTGDAEGSKPAEATAPELPQQQPHHERTAAGTTAGGDVQQQDETTTRTAVLQQDAFLVFRALCKLSTRTSDTAAVQDATAA